MKDQKRSSLVVPTTAQEAFAERMDVEARKLELLEAVLHRLGEIAARLTKLTEETEETIEDVSHGRRRGR